MLKSGVTASRERVQESGVTAQRGSEPCVKAQGESESCVTVQKRDESCVMAEKKRKLEFRGTTTERGEAKSGGATSRKERTILVSWLPTDESDIESKVEDKLGESEGSEIC